MKSIKTMLLGIAFLIIASFGIPFWIAGSAVGAIVFFAALAAGLFLSVDGFLTKDDE